MDLRSVEENLPGTTMRQKIMRLESAMTEFQQIDIPPVHYFAKGLYAREIFIPKGTLLTGKIHKSEHLNIISLGDISVMTEEGIRRIRAPFAMISKPGIKRVGYAHEDTVWTTIHATGETDLDKIEEELIAKGYEEADLVNSMPEVALLSEVTK